MKYKFRKLPHKCNGCVWLKKVDEGHYHCPFFSCLKEVDSYGAKSTGGGEAQPEKG